MSRDSKLDMSALYSQNVPSPEPLPSRVQSASTADAPTVAAQPTPPPHTQATPAPMEPPARKPRQVNFYADPMVYDRFKKAHRATLVHTDFDSLSAHLNQLVLNECERLERDHNDGRPFGS